MMTPLFHLLFWSDILNLKLLLLLLLLLKFFNKQLSKRFHVGMSQTVIFLIIRLVELSVNVFLACALTSESLFQI
jgi:hypothetical protein